MNQNTHRGFQMVDAVVFAFEERPEVPQAGPHSLDRLVDAVVAGLVGILGFGVVQSCAVEVGQVLVVGARPVTQRRAGGIRIVHGFQCGDDPSGSGGLFDLLA